MSATHLTWNSGVLACILLPDNCNQTRLHLLIGTEYRNASNLHAQARRAASHRQGQRVLQLNVPGGRHQPNETAAQTAVREFWEETGRLIHCDELRACVEHRGAPFYFEQSKYCLFVTRDCVPFDLPHVFAQRVARDGYPAECLLQLFWLPWHVLKRATGTRAGIVNLRHDALEPRRSRAPLSAFALELFGDASLRRALDAMDQQQPVLQSRKRPRLSLLCSNSFPLITTSTAVQRRHDQHLDTEKTHSTLRSPSETARDVTEQIASV